MKKGFLLLSLIAILVLSACVAPGSDPGASLAAQQQQSVSTQPRTISVNGTGQVTLAPDIAYITVGVQSQSENVSDALTENNQKAETVVSALSEMGIAAEDIQTSSFNIYPQQQYGPDGQVSSTTYVVNNTVYVTVRDLQVLGRLLDVVVRSGANSINGITFDVVDKSAAISEARRLATESARSQAEEMAAAAGVQLGLLQSLNVYSSNPPVPYYDSKGGFAADASQVPLSAGQIVIRVEVSASYLIQ